MSLIELSIDITYKCPFSCLFCSSPSHVPSVNMEIDTALQCLDFAQEVFSYDQCRIIITGGEPLSFNLLPSFISKWAGNNRQIVLCTTAAVDVGEDYWRKLYSVGLHTVHLSLHCISEVLSKDIFGKNYEVAIVNKNVELISAAGIDVYVNYVPTKLNTGAFDGVFNYCIEKGIKKIRVLGLARQGRANENWRKIALSEKEEKSFVDHALKKSNGPFVKIEFAGLPQHKICTHVDEDGQCIGGKSFFHVNANGDIYPCPSVKSVELERIGSVFLPSKTFASHKYYCESSRMSTHKEAQQI